jgi:hypothetical protein
VKANIYPFQNTIINKKKIIDRICNSEIQHMKLSNEKLACDTVFILFHFTSDVFNTNIYLSMEWRYHEKSIT